MSWKNREQWSKLESVWQGEAALKVLIVEDDPQLAEEIRNWLELDRYLCEWTSSGVAAIDFIERSLVDLVILDWQLPDLTGLSGIHILWLQNFWDICFLICPDQHSVTYRPAANQ